MISVTSYTRVCSSFHRLCMFTGKKRHLSGDADYGKSQKLFSSGNA